MFILLYKLLVRGNKECSFLKNLSFFNYRLTTGGLSITNNSAEIHVISLFTVRNYFFFQAI